MTMASTMYMMPIFLWSMLVNQSRHSAPQANLVSRPARDAAQRHHGEGADQDGLMVWNRFQTEAAEDQLYQVKIVRHLYFPGKKKLGRSGVLLR
jgi:hypothetical protein